MELKIYPDGVLRKRCRPVEEIDDAFVSRAEDMLEFMYEADGVGLAGPQIGWTDRIVTLDVDLDRDGPRIYVNPRIIGREGHAEEEEGCLSLPGLRVQVPRSERVAVVAYTLEGERLEMEAEGLAARAWQHELDHINGVLIVDRLPPARLMSIRSHLKRLEREWQDLKDQHQD
ncbi:MAG: peptide deformylase [Candidatus Brocadiia bacterium]